MIECTKFTRRVGGAAGGGSVLGRHFDGLTIAILIPSMQGNTADVVSAYRKFVVVMSYVLPLAKQLLMYRT